MCPGKSGIGRHAMPSVGTAETVRVVEWDVLLFTLDSGYPHARHADCIETASFRVG